MKPIDLIDSAISIVNPSLAVKITKARSTLAKIRSFDAAGSGKRTKSWTPVGGDSNSVLEGGLPVLRARSRDLVRNSPWASRAVNILTSDIVGKGIIPEAKAKAKSKTATKKAEELFIAWGDEVTCDSAGRVDFYGLQQLVARTVIESGSCLIRRRRRKAEDDLPVPMQLQVLEPDHLDTTLTKSVPGGQIVQGVEFDRLGRRRAYWLFPEHPGSNIYYLSSMQSKRVPAEDIIHVYRLERAGQVDGIPWGASCIVRIKDLDSYEHAQLIRQKIAACYTAFIRDMEAPEELTDSQVDMVEKFEPGMIEELPPGKDIIFADPPAAEGYGEFTKGQLRAIAVGFGLTYEALSGDYSQVNFSSARMARLNYHNSLDQWQDLMMIPHLCKTVWRWFNEAAVISGKLNEPVPAVWTVPKRAMIDPLKETQATALQIRNGTKTLSEAIRQTGRDPAEFFAEAAQDFANAQAAGLLFDCDPSAAKAAIEAENEAQKNALTKF